MARIIILKVVKFYEYRIPDKYNVLSQDIQDCIYNQDGVTCKALFKNYDIYPHIIDGWDKQGNEIVADIVI